MLYKINFTCPKCGNKSFIVERCLTYEYTSIEELSMFEGELNIEPGEVIDSEGHPDAEPSYHCSICHFQIPVPHEEHLIAWLRDNNMIEEV